MPRNQFPSTQRCKAWGRITILFALIALAITALPTASFAGTDTAGNVLATDNDANPSGVEGDLYWAYSLSWMGTSKSRPPWSNPLKTQT